MEVMEPENNSKKESVKASSDGSAHWSMMDGHRRPSVLVVNRGSVVNNEPNSPADVQSPGLI